MLTHGLSRSLQVSRRLQRCDAADRRAGGGRRSNAQVTATHKQGAGTAARTQGLQAPAHECPLGTRIVLVVHLLRPPSSHLHPVLPRAHCPQQLWQSCGGAGACSQAAWYPRSHRGVLAVAPPPPSAKLVTRAKRACQPHPAAAEAFANKDTCNPRHSCVVLATQVPSNAPQCKVDAVREYGGEPATQ